MNEADRATAERHRSMWEEFRRRPQVSVWAGRMPLPREVAAMVGFVIPVDDPAVRRSLGAVVARLEGTGCVTAFPPDYWHITVAPPALLTSGDPDPPRLLPLSFVQVALDQARVSLQGTGPFDVTVRGLNAFQDVVVAVPYDGGHGRELGGVIRCALPEFPERYWTGHEPLPHISLAQYGRDDRLDEVIELVQGEREADYGRFSAGRLEMFVLPLDGGVPGPVEKHAVPLDRP